MLRLLFSLFVFGCFVYMIVRMSQVKNDRKNNELVEEHGSILEMSTWKKTHDKVFLFFFWWFIAVNAFLLLLLIVIFVYRGVLKQQLQSLTAKNTVSSSKK